MRKSRFCASLLGLLIVGAPFSGGLAPFAMAHADPGMDSATLNQTVPPAQTWDERMAEIIRRMRERMGDPVANVPVPLKTGADALRARLELYGFPPDLTAADLEEMSADATELADCADLEPTPPYGTSYALIVYLHDLGKDLQSATSMY